MSLVEMDIVFCHDRAVQTVPDDDCASNLPRKAGPPTFCSSWDVPWRPPVRNIEDPATNWFRRREAEL